MYMQIILYRFEENNMMRLSRKRKSMDTGRSNRQEMDDLAEFSDLRYLTDDVHVRLSNIVCYP